MPLGGNVLLFTKKSKTQLHCNKRCQSTDHWHPPRESLCYESCLSPVCFANFARVQKHWFNSICNWKLWCLKVNITLRYSPAHRNSNLFICGNDPFLSPSLQCPGPKMAPFSGMTTSPNVPNQFTGCSLFHCLLKLLLGFYPFPVVVVNKPVLLCCFNCTLNHSFLWQRLQVVSSNHPQPQLTPSLSVPTWHCGVPKVSSDVSGGVTWWGWCCWREGAGLVPKNAAWRASRSCQTD